jgi:hypothetical protein
MKVRSLIHAPHVGVSYGKLYTIDAGVDHDAQQVTIIDDDGESHSMTGKAFEYVPDDVTLTLNAKEADALAWLLNRPKLPVYSQMRDTLQGISDQLLLARLDA